MSYSFYIGNAVPEFSKDDFPDLRAGWVVTSTAHPDAPTFPNDEMTGNGNSRHPGYSAWAEFCRVAGLYEVFYDDYGRLHADHPGCIGIDETFASAVRLSLERWQTKATLPPGFDGWSHEGPPLHDPILARLIWLDWWVRWALDNCETPAISNT